MPVGDSQFYALLGRAFSGNVSRHEMHWKISLVEAWSMIHAGGILNGEAFIWPDPELSRSGRMMLQVKSIRERFKQGGINAFIDL